MPCDYSKYPKNWKSEIRPAILERANNCCEFCGKPNYAQVWQTKTSFMGHWYWSLDQEHWIFKNGKPVDQCSFSALGLMVVKQTIERCIEKGDITGPTKVILTIAHLDHDTQNNDPENLRALCQRCHNRWDAEHRAKHCRGTACRAREDQA